jgi:hypothetical protein
LPCSVRSTTGPEMNVTDSEKGSAKGMVPLRLGMLPSRGHAMGATRGAMLTEIVRQLRGEAGQRQVANSKVGMIHNAGVGGIQISVLTT